MNPKDHFALGCKLFGVYCLVLSIPTLISLFHLFVVPNNLTPELTTSYIISNILTAMVPVCYVFAGLYLIKGRGSLFGFVNLEKCSLKSVEGEYLFIIYLKFLGMYLIVQFLPDFLGTLSSFLVYYNAPQYMDMYKEKQFIYYNLLPSVAGIIIGIYLLVSGCFFVKLAFRKSIARSLTNDNDKNEIG